MQNQIQEFPNSHHTKTFIEWSNDLWNRNTKLQVRCQLCEQIALT